MKKLLSITLLIALVAAMAVVANAGSQGQKFANGDVAFVAPGSIVIDGVKDAAYANTANFGCDSIHPGSPANNVGGTSARTYVLWDGIYIYFLTEVKDNSAFATSMMDYMYEGGCWADCVEYFVAWQNSDCPGAQKWQSNSMPDVNQYRAVPTPTDPSLGGYWVNCYEGDQGFGTYADLQFEFRDEPGFITAGACSKTASGWITETKIKLAKTDKLGGGNYTYGEGTKIGLMVQLFDAFGVGVDYDKTYIAISDPTGTSADNKSLNQGIMQSAWEPGLYWYVELKGGADVVTEAPDTQAPDTEEPDTQAPDTQAPDTQAPDTQAPDTQAPDTQAPDTQAPVTQKPSNNTAPQTSDVAVAGIAVLATLALAGVVVAKKVR
jgi:hypothetical protein